ncbi:DUF3060 domain-containing protein [Dactylosporangium sp. NPDC051484]|uniref:DUF3060 domain-containing protein n=1 Tax=Dactylosporangium sp. NPDC051484 TaxID=3154942 RepID=UPI00344E33F4
MTPVRATRGRSSRETTGRGLPEGRPRPCRVRGAKNTCRVRGAKNTCRVRGAKNTCRVRGAKNTCRVRGAKNTVPGPRCQEHGAGNARLPAPWPRGTPQGERRTAGHPLRVTGRRSRCGV